MPKPFSDSDKAAEMSKNKYERRQTSNDLIKLVLEEGLHKKSLFKEIKSRNEQEISDFPKLSKAVLEEEIIFG